MSNIAQLIGYYPKYEYLDDLLAKTGMKKINFFMDFKNCCQALYQEWAIRYVVDQTQGSTQVDCSIFGAFLEFISFHKNYLKKRNITGEFYVSFEHGDSMYHKKIDKNYKANRGASDFFNLPAIYKDTFFKILTKNLNTIERVGNKLPGVHVYQLNYLEADFVPYYIMNYINKDQTDALNIIYSTDKDYLQCINNDRTFQFFRHAQNYKFCKKDYLFRAHLKFEEGEDKDLVEEIGCEYFPLFLAIMGDTSDNVPKYCAGIGNKTYIRDVHPYLKNLVGTPDEMYENLKTNNKIFKEYKGNCKHLKLIVEKEKEIIQNLKLVSFRLLCEYVEAQFPMEILEKRKLIWEVTNNVKKVDQAIVLENALKGIGLGDLVSQHTLYSLF